MCRECKDDDCHLKCGKQSSTKSRRTEADAGVMHLKVQKKNIKESRDSPKLEKERKALTAALHSMCTPQIHSPQISGHQNGVRIDSVI